MRKLFFLITVIGWMMLAAACSGNEQTETNNDGESVELTWMFWAGSNDRQHW